MLHSVMNAIFRCGHQRTTFPITPRHKYLGSAVSEAPNGTYVACLDCGKEFAYDWKSMRIGEQMIEQPAPQEVQAGVR